MSATRLHLAAMDGDEAAVNRLLDEGADVDARTENNATPLQFAALSGNTSVVQTLLDRGADVNGVPTQGGTPVRIAIGGGHAEIVRLLIARGADVDIEPVPIIYSDEDRRKMQGAVREAVAEMVAQAPEEVRSSLFAGEPQTWPGEEGTTQELNDFHEMMHVAGSVDRVLKLAVRSWNVETLRVVLESGVKPSPLPRNGSVNLLSMALRYPDGLEMAGLLLEHGADPNGGVPALEETPLMSAILTGDIPFTKLLIDAGARAGSDRMGIGLFSLARSRNDRKMMHFLLEHLTRREASAAETRRPTDSDAEPSARTVRRRKEAKWLSCVEAENVEEIRAALSSGADINNDSLRKHTALMIASRKGNDAITRLLLDAGADANIGNEYGLRSLHIAARQGATGVVELLLAANAQVDAETKEGKTPLFYAASNGHGEAADMLIHAGARLDVVEAILLRRLDVVDSFWKRGTAVGYANALRMTALHAAVQIGDLSMIGSLLDRGADIEAVAGSGTTPLSLAIDARNFDAVQLLLDRGASPLPQKNTKPLLSAVSLRNEPIVRLLLKRGAPLNVFVDEPRLERERHWSPSRHSVLALMIAHEADVELTQRSSEGADANCESTWAVLRTLIEFGADVNVKVSATDSLLVGAIELGAPIDVIRLVLERGADLTPKPLQNTPVLAAVRRERSEVVEALLIAGADPNEASGLDTPLSVARERDLFVISRLLEQYGARETQEADLQSALVFLDYGMEDCATHRVTTRTPINFRANPEKSKSVRAERTAERIAERRAKLVAEILANERQSLAE